MPERGLQLALDSGQSLPTEICWQVNDGYLRATGSTDQAEVFTLGIWGPGEIVIPELFIQQPLVLRALSTARVQEFTPDAHAREIFSMNHIQQMGMLLQLTRIRPAELRLFRLLDWLSDRFGAHLEQGRSVPLEAMNLTHRHLAEMASMSRVTVTKALGHFREQGWLQQVGGLELLSEEGISIFEGGALK